MELVGATSETEWELDVVTRGGEKILTLAPYPLSRAAMKRAEEKKEEIRQNRIQSIKNVRAKKKKRAADALTAQAQETIRALDAAEAPDKTVDE
jgi:hypothetical protein